MAIAKHLDREDLINLIKGAVVHNPGVDRLKETKSEIDLWNFYYKIKEEMNNGTSHHKDTPSGSATPNHTGD